MTFSTRKPAYRTGRLAQGRFPWILLIAAVVIAFDFFTKEWFLKHYQLGESHAIAPWLSWTLVYNTGSAFGLFQNNNRLLLALAYGIFFVLLYSARGLCERGGRWAFWGIALILGGAIGNIIDRHLYGHVIDFIDLHKWPVFNIADSAISTGAVCAAIGLYVNRERS